MFRSTKVLKAEVESLKAYILDLEDRIKELEISNFELLSEDYFNWKSMANANKDSAQRQGHFYLNSKTDIQLLEQIISEINTDPDLCALLTTSDGTTLSLRTHPQPKLNIGIKPFTGAGEE